MGRFAILLVFLGVLTVNHASMSRTETVYDVNLTQSDYEQKVLARQTAESALELIVDRVKQTWLLRKSGALQGELPSYDVSLSQNVYRDGDYETRSTETSPGEISVHSKGTLDINEYSIDAKIEFKYGRTLDAITFDGEYEDLKINATNKMTVSGLDRKTDGYNDFLGSDGDGVDVHAASVRSPESYSDFFDDATSQQLEGMLGEGDVVNQPPKMDLGLLAAEIADYAGANRVTFEGGGQITNKTPLGSKNNPMIAVVNGDFKMKNQSEGYGVLLVDGNLDIGAGSRFEGLILVVGANRQITVGGNVEIYGALASHFEEASGKGQTEIDIQGDARVQYSSEALIRVGNFIGSLSKENNTELVVTRVREGASRKNGLTSLQRAY